MKIQNQFMLNSSDKNKYWSQLTPNQWNNMLPVSWTDKGFHFFTRIKKRGAVDGLNSPADLELEINKGAILADSSKADRYIISLNLLNSSGTHLKVIYDYNKNKKRCELVTISY